MSCVHARKGMQHWVSMRRALPGGLDAGGGARAVTLVLAAAVGAAFADSSIVVLALPDLYGAFDTTIVGVSWVITSYNVAVAAAALALLPLAARLEPRIAARAGIVLFAAASAGCAVSWRLEALVGFRVLQGLGGALLLGAALPLLAELTGSRLRGGALWTAAGTAGAAAGPALGGVLTQLADWRAIFAVQAPVALVALVRAPAAGPTSEPERQVKDCYKGRGAGMGAAANAGLALLFGGLVGALFLSVLLVITAWSLPPILGALVVSALPVTALAARPLQARLPAAQAAAGGALLLALGLAALALLPRASEALAATALAVCGAGLGLAVPVLSRAALAGGGGGVSRGLAGVGARHLGLVLALALVAPLLSQALERDGRRALLTGTRVILDGNIPLTKKVPIALDLRDALAEANKGEVPDLARPFDERGAGSDERLRRLRDDLIATLERVITRSFREAFAVSALLALLAVLPALRLGRAP